MKKITVPQQLLGNCGCQIILTGALKSTGSDKDHFGSERLPMIYCGMDNFTNHDPYCKCGIARFVRKLYLPCHCPKKTGKLINFIKTYTTKNRYTCLFYKESSITKSYLKTRYC